MGPQFGKLDPKGASKFVAPLPGGLTDIWSCYNTWRLLIGEATTNTITQFFSVLLLAMLRELLLSVSLWWLVNS